MMNYAPRIHVSGAVAEVDRATAVIRELRLRGASVLLDWPAELRRQSALADEPSNGLITDWVSSRIWAISQADVVLVLIGGPLCSVRDHEVGAALMRANLSERPRIVLCGPNIPRGGREVWKGRGQYVGSDAVAVRDLTLQLLSVPSVITRVCIMVVQIRHDTLIDQDQRRDAISLLSDVEELQALQALHRNSRNSDLLIDARRVLHAIIETPLGKPLAQLDTVTDSAGRLSEILATNSYVLAYERQVRVKEQS
jgi:hypothetical protein